MAEVVLDRPIKVAEWEALADPDGGRYEILDGRLVMTPSPDADHGRFGEDLADMLRIALARAGMDLPVTLDVEWRSVAADVVTDAPRGDVVVGRSLDPDKRIHDDIPLLAVEVWSARTRPSERNAKRSYWAGRGLRHYWELHLGTTQESAQLDVHDLTAAETLVSSTSGHERIALTEPVEIELTPALIHGWMQREFERAETELDRQRAQLAELTGQAQRATARAEEAERELERLRARLDGDGS